MPPRMASAAEEGLVGRWRFTPADIQDGQARPLAGSLAAKIQGPVQFASKQPECLLLDGRKTYIGLTSDLAKANLPKRELTAEAWIWLDSVLEWGGIIGAIQDNGSHEQGWLLGTRKEQFLFGLSTADVDDGDGKLTYLTSNSIYEPGQWYHVVGTYDGTAQRIYVDGRLKSESNAQSGDINYPKKAFYCIGAYHDDNEQHRHAGRVAEISVFDRALTAKEIAARFEARKHEFPRIEPAKPVVTDWPTYLHDNARTGITPEKIPVPLEIRWVHQARRPPEPAWPPPANQDFWHGRFNLRPRVIFDRAYHVVSADGRVFYGSSADDQVRCLDIETGEELWSFFTEGPVRLAPQVAEGGLYFGSDDGHVYCLNAEDGTLRWRFRGAPSDRLIAGNGRLISVWPIRSGVVVHEGEARFAAGLFPRQGVHQYALDAQSGRLLGQGTLAISPQGYMERRGDQLFVSNGRAPAEFFAKLRRMGKGTGDYLGQTSEDYPYAIIGAADVRFVGGENKVAALRASDGSMLWNAQVEGRAYSLAVASGCLLVSTDQGKVYCFAPKSPNVASAETVAETDATFPYPSEQVRRTYEAVARQIIEETGITKGYCLVIGSEHGRLVYELTRQTQLRVIGVEEDAEKVAAARRSLDRAGLYGRATIIQRSLDRLPVSDCLINLVVSDRLLFSGEMPVEVTEVQRVLRPGGGVAYFGQSDDVPQRNKLAPDALQRWLDRTADDWIISRQGALWAKFERGPLSDTGEWTHLYADAANTACSQDGRVTDRLALQWFGRPGPRLMVDRHHRTVAPLSKDGRLFVPGSNHVFAVDAYNGSPLWDHDVPGSRRVGVMRDCGYMVATEDVLYVAAQDQCHRFDPETGQAATSFPTPQATDGQVRHWGYLASVGDRLLGSVTKPNAARRDHSKATIQEGTYGDFRPIVTCDFVFCLTRHDGKLQWKHADNTGAIINPTLTIGNGRIFLIESTNPATRTEPSGRSTLADLLAEGANLVALDLASGEVVWKVPVDYGAIQHQVYMSFAQDLLVIVGSRNVDSGQKDDKGRKIEHVWYDVHAIDAKTGKSLWTRSQNNQSRSGGDHGEQDKHPVIVGDTVFVEPYAYHLPSGKPLDGWRLDRGGGGCGTLSACATKLFFRASNPTMCDITTGQKTKVNTVSRPGCWINIIPAAGLVLIPEASSGCTCNLPLQTSMAFIPEK